MKIKRILSAGIAAAMVSLTACAPNTAVENQTDSGGSTAGGDTSEMSAAQEANLARAKELLAEAGYPDGQVLPAIEYMYTDMIINKPVAEAVQRMWSELGANVTLESKEWSTLLETRKNGEYMTACDRWIYDYSDPIGVLDMFTSESGNNDPQYRNSEYDALISKIKTSTDNNERFTLMHQAEDMLMTQHVFAPVLYYTDYYMLDPKLDSTVWASPLGWKFFRLADAKDLAVCAGPTPNTIDPALSSAIDSGEIDMHLFEGLTRWDTDNNLEPALADKWEVSEDGLKYTFHLKNNLKWSDGSPLTAHDFEYSWKRAASPDTAADYAYLYEVLSGFDKASEGNFDALGVKAADDTTLEVTLNAPTPFFMELTAFPAFFPVQKATVEANGDSWTLSAATAVSNGPFKLKEFVQSSNVTLEKNPNYWDAANVKPETLKFVLTDDQTAQLDGFQKGTLQFIDDIPANELDTLMKDAAFKIVNTLGDYYITFNNQQAPFDDPKVREAFSLAIDRKFIADTVAKGYQPAGAWVAPGVKEPDGTEFRSKGKDYIDVTP